jgi:hypothetical protein
MWGVPDAREGHGRLGEAGLKADPILYCDEVVIDDECYMFKVPKFQTVSEWGLIIMMTLLMLTGTTIILRHRRHA